MRGSASSLLVSTALHNGRHGVADPPPLPPMPHAPGGGEGTDRASGLAVGGRTSLVVCPLLGHSAGKARS